jgi:hypothetical protein
VLPPAPKPLPSAACIAGVDVALIGLSPSDRFLLYGIYPKASKHS